MASSTAAGAGAVLDSNSTRDSFIPLFSGLHSEYREWRQRINIYLKKMKLQKREQEAVLNLIGSLSGTAWKLLESFPLEDCEKTGAADKILTILDKAFEYDKRVQLPADFDRYFVTLQRQPGQTLLQYCTQHDEFLRKLEDHKVTLPGPVQGWHLLRKAGLTREQRQLITTQCPNLERVKVQEAMFLVLGQDYKAAVSSNQDRRGHHGYRGKGRGYAAQEDEAYGEPAEWHQEEWSEGGYYEESLYEDGYYENEETYDHEEPYDEVTEFDNDAVYYQGTAEPNDPMAEAELYDEAYASYIDARKRFNDIKLSRGYLPIVALTDAGPALQPGVGSSTSSPTSSPHGRKGKGGKSKPSGKGKNKVRYPPRGAGKAPDPKGRAAAAAICFRCGQSGHTTYNCPVPKNNSTSNKRQATGAVEGMAAHGDGNVEMKEHGMVIFTDQSGAERPDCTMMDPGASAFLSGYGPFRRYAQCLKEAGYNLEGLEFLRCRRQFHFGGDASLECRWTVKLPVFFEDQWGYAQLYLLPGETPMLLGRPILEALGVTMDYKHHLLRIDGGPWFPALRGSHGEYLLPLLDGLVDYKTEDFLIPDFDLVVPGDGGTSGEPLTFLEFNEEENVFHSRDQEEENKSLEETRSCRPHFLRTCEIGLETEENKLHGYITKELHSSPERPRVLWEIYCGRSRTSEVAEELGMVVETFGYHNGWDFDLQEHRDLLLQRQAEEMPDEVLLSPTCGPWSQMQNLAAQTSEQKAELYDTRHWHHRTHLQFVRKLYMNQVLGGRHAHLEQPEHALSWRTTALKDLPGLWTPFDQCAHGCCCLDSDGCWRLVRKPTGVMTTKMAVHTALSKRCTRDHDHCYLEGSAPGLGRRTKYLEEYQPGLAATFAMAISVPEIIHHWESAMAVPEVKAVTGHLVKLQAEGHGEALRTVQKLHRNLGHPSPQSLVEMLQSRGASDAVVEAARNYQCASCLMYKKPNQTSPSSMPRAKEFGEIVQADVMWIKSKDKKSPVMSFLDEATKYQTAILLRGETSADFIKALEKGWVKHFGLPKQLHTDEGRGWTSQELVDWTSNHNVNHTIAPGEAHTRLSHVERRHSILRKAVEIYMTDLKIDGHKGIRQALVYVLPQLNSTPSVAGFSPTQWLLGRQVQLPGDLPADVPSPAQLDGHQSFEELLLKRTAAKQALLQAETDRKLRRALLRQYQGTNIPLVSGQQCYFWRDARQADLVKIRWLGPARIILREDDEQGRPQMYWVSYKTQLLRCAPHHVRADPSSTTTRLENLQEAKKEVQNLRSRGVTRFLDLPRLNKQNLADVEEDEEGQGEPVGGEDDQPPRQRRRLDPQLPLLPEGEGEMEEFDNEYSPTTLANSPVAIPLDFDETEYPSPPREHHQHQPSQTPPPGTSSTTVQPSPLPQPRDGLVGVRHPEDAMGHPEDAPEGPSTIVIPDDEPEPGVEPPAPPTAPASPTRTTPMLDSITQSYYLPSGPEDFRQHRLRHAQQETMSYGPLRGRRFAGGPYGETTSMPSSTTPTTEEHAAFCEAFDLTSLEQNALPTGWIINEESGYMSFQGEAHDYWEVRAGCLIRHHLKPRRRMYDVGQARDCPIPVEKLDPVRVSLLRLGHGKHRVVTDGNNQQNYKVIPTGEDQWTGVTVFQINGATRKEMGMYGNSLASQVVKSQKNYEQKKVKKDGNINERHLTVEERSQFMAAKVKELKSFFENGVWEFNTTREAEASRTLTSRMILKWSKNPDGSPRAKARLIVRGYADKDALEGKIDTAAPTTSRLSRSILLSLMSTLKWKGWTADVSTAFLQGLPQERKLWVKLPREALTILGADENTRMLLRKPCYGQLDAPRRWFLEACRRLRALGFRQHLLDPCMFLLYEKDFKENYKKTPDDQLLGEGQLCGVICIHVDDMFGGGAPGSETYASVEKALKQAFNFREWQTSSKLEYCGATLEHSGHNWKLHHQEYLRKVKPVQLNNDRKPEDVMTPSEVTRFRGLLGSLQWPAVQSQPHLQCATSILAGTMSAGLVRSIVEGNKLLKFAKDNSDVSLNYNHLGPASTLRLVCMFDAAFCVRRDSSSQGGYITMIVPERVFNGEEADYHVIDWKSAKLPRVARSSLAAEAQAAGQAVDPVDFVCRFWEHLLKPDMSLESLLQEKSSLRPVVVTDAKALYDSYHREGISGSLTDKRVGLEVCVVKERLEDLGGSFKWVSSEKQYADGLTKDQTKQLLADRLRGHRIKLVWDPEFVAAKRKEADARQDSKMEFAVTRSKKKGERRGQVHEAMYAQDEQSNYEIEYVNLASKAAEISNDKAMILKNDNSKANYQGCGKAVMALMMAIGLPCVNGTEVNVTDQCPAELRGEKDQLGWSLFETILVIMVLMVIWFSWMVGSWMERRKCRKYFVGMRDIQREKAINEKNEEKNRADGLAKELQELRQVCELQGRQLQDRVLAARQLQNTVRLMENSLESHWELKEHARIVMERVVEEVMDHHENCPLNAAILVSARGTVWHLRDDCHFVQQAVSENVRRLRPCSGCAMRVQSPYRASEAGTTLEEEINGYFTHSSNV